MNAIASAVEIAAGNTFMALHQVEGLALPERARGVGKACLLYTSSFTSEEEINDHSLHGIRNTLSRVGIRWRFI